MLSSSSSTSFLGYNKFNKNQNSYTSNTESVSTSNLIVINCASNSTLQDLKIQPSSGVYSYNESDDLNSCTSNRMIVWRAKDDILHLSEYSLNRDLYGNEIQIQFKNSLILHNGITIEEAVDKVVILVTTIVSLHRIVFPHPKQLFSNPNSISSLPCLDRSISSSNESCLCSIFHNGSPFNDSNTNFVQLQNSFSQNAVLASPAAVPYLASCSWVDANLDAYFVLSTASSSLNIIRLPESSRSDTQTEIKIQNIDLKQSNLLEKIFDGIRRRSNVVPSMVSRTGTGTEAAIDLLHYSTPDDDIILALCRDNHIRVYSMQQQTFLVIQSIPNQSNDSRTPSNSSPLKNSSTSVQKVVSMKFWRYENELNCRNLVVYTTSKDRNRFYFYQTEISKMVSPKKIQPATKQSISPTRKPQFRYLFQSFVPSHFELIDYFVHESQLWAMWQNNETVNIQHYPIETNFEVGTPSEWMPVMSDINACPEMGVRSPATNPREFFINEIFWKGNFSFQTISKAVNVLNRNLEDRPVNTTKIDLLIQEAVKLVDNVIRNETQNQANMEMEMEHYIQRELDAWSQLYQFCLDYHVDENEPLSIFVDGNTGVKGIIRKARVEFIPSLSPFDQMINHYLLYCKQNHIPVNQEQPNGNVPSSRSDSCNAENVSSISAFDYRLNVLMQPIQDPNQSPGFISTMENMKSSVRALLHGISAINVAMQDKVLLDFEAFLQRMSSYSSKSKMSLADITKKITEDGFEMSSLLDPSFALLIDDFFEKCPFVLEAIKFFILQISFDYLTKKQICEYFQMNNDLQHFLLSNNDGAQLKMQDALKYEINSVFTNLLSSRCGLEFTVTSISRVLQMRYKFCRDLFLFQYMLISFPTKGEYKSNIIREVKAYMIPVTSQLLFALNYLNWTCETPMITPNIWWSSSEIIEIRNLKSSPSPITGIRGSFENCELLSVLEMRDCINLNRVGILSHESIFYDAYPRASILYFFLQFNGGILAKRLLSYTMAYESEQICGMPIQSSYFGSGIWSNLMSFYMKSICQMLWPFSSGQFKLAEFLLGVGQFNLLERYVHMLHPWCTLFSHSRNFAQGICYLMTGEGDKAIEEFNFSIWGVASEPFLMKIFAQKGRMEKIKETAIDPIISDGGDSPATNVKNFETSLGSFLNVRTIYRFYSRLIQLFKRYSTPDHVIELAEYAIHALQKYNDPDHKQHHSALQSILFTCHLRLGNIDEAYNSMMNNLDPDQRQNCLRQFIVNLCESGNSERLVSYSYTGMEDFFVSILESKARSCCVRKLAGDIERKLQPTIPSAIKKSSFEPETISTNYYFILYSFFMSTSNFRKAAQIMYDYYRQLSQEFTGNEQMLQAQAGALLMVRNCLKCVDDPKFSWVVKHTTMNKSENDRHNLKRKYGYSSDDSKIEYKEKHKTVIEIIDMDELLNKYELICARLKLLERNPKEYAIAATILSPEEVVVLCISAHLYEPAFRISELFHLPYEPIFEGLTSQLVQLLKGSQNCRRIHNEMMLALTTDSSFGDPLSGKMDDEDFTMELLDMFYENTASSPESDYITYSLFSICDRMWHLILYYLYRYQPNPRVSTRLFKVVAEKLLSNGVMIPVSFKRIYKKSNCPELIRLLMTYDFLAEATELSIDYMKAFMGFGFEFFDLSTHLSPNCPPLCIPLHIFDCLADLLQKEIKLAKSIDRPAWSSWPPGEAESQASVDEDGKPPKADYESLLQNLNHNREQLDQTIKTCSQNI